MPVLRHRTKPVGTASAAKVRLAQANPSIETHARSNVDGDMRPSRKRRFVAINPLAHTLAFQIHSNKAFASTRERSAAGARIVPNGVDHAPRQLCGKRYGHE